jgi:hypothetical protein
MRANHPRLFALLIFGALGDPAIGQEAVDMRLVDAGFIMRPANTPEKIARLRQLPPRKFVRRKTGAGHYYIYADPHYCKCALVGSERAMQAYRDMVRSPSGAPTLSIAPSGASPGQELIADLNTDIGDVPETDILHFKF